MKRIFYVITFLTISIIFLESCKDAKDKANPDEEIKYWCCTSDSLRHCAQELEDLSSTHSEDEEYSRD